jgi:hypothetical protein
MSIAPMVPPEVVPSTVRGPRQAVVIPFPSARPSEPARPAAWPLARPRRIVRPARQPRSSGPPSRLRRSGLAVSGQGVSGLRVSGLRVPGLGVSGLRVSGLGVSGLRVPGLRVPGLGVSGLRLTRRGRAVLAAAALLGVLAFGWLGATLVHTRTTIPPSAPAVVEVRPGETVWSIAQRVAPDADTRAVVDAIVARNGLVGGAVHPGQRLIIRP